MEREIPIGTLAETRIRGLHCIVASDDGESTYCHITNSKGVCSSLGLADDLGGLEDDYGEIHPLAESTLNAIYSWAESTGWY